MQKNLKNKPIPLPPSPPNPIVISTYYVSPLGNDSNTGTIENPFKTIQKTCNVVKAGDTIYIREGTYKERINLQTSGTIDNYITITNYNNENVIIDGTGIDWFTPYDAWNCLFDLNKQQYIKINGIKVINSLWAGIGSEHSSGECSHIIVQNCQTYNTKSSGIVFFYGSDIVVDNCSIEKACTGTISTQECLSLATIDNFIISNNKVFDCTNNFSRQGGEGIDVKNGCINGKIYNNEVYNIAKIGIYVDAYSKYQYNIEVFDNNIDNCSQGIVVANENDGFLENVNIHNNIVNNIKDFGYVVAGYGHDTSHAMNNIIFDQNLVSNLNSNGISMFLNNPQATNIKIINNNFDAMNGTSIYINGWNKETTIIQSNNPDDLVSFN